MLLRNLATLLSAALVSAIISIAINKWSSLQCGDWPLATAFLFVISLAANLVYSFQKNKQELTKLMFGGVAVRLLVGMTALVVYWYFYTDIFFAFALHFIVQYVVFSIGEINFLSYLVRSHHHSPGNQHELR